MIQSKHNNRRVLESLGVNGAVPVSVAKSAAPSPDQLMAMIMALKAENDALKAAKPTRAIRVTTKVTDKGGLSVYHGSRFPTTLYRDQWERIFAAKDEIMAALANLPHKGE